MIRSVLLLLVAITLSSCLGAGKPSLSDNERLLLVCESWLSVFKRIDTRDQFGLASGDEIDAIETALPILNPICTQNLSTASGFDIYKLESALLAALQKTRGES